MAFIQTWAENVPDGSEARSLGDDRIRAFKYAIRERLAIDHEFYADESGHSYVGYHTIAHFTEQSSPTAIANIGQLYCKDVSGVTELFFMDSAGNEKQLTNAGTLNLSATEAVLLTGNQTIAGIKTFSSSPIVPTPTTDMQASTKKYVDDQTFVVADHIAIETGTVANGGTIPLPSGYTAAQCKWFVSINSLITGNDSWGGPANAQTTASVSVNASRVVTITSEDGRAGHEETGTANYIIIGIK